MPTMATQAAPAAQQTANGKAAATLPVVPFVRASFENRQDTGYQKSLTLTGATQSLGVIDVPAYGYLRFLDITVAATGAVAGVLAADAPWNVLRDISLTEPNGAPIFQVTSGFSLYLTNKWGGYRWGDPKASPAYSADAAGNFTFKLRIPVEINAREALGALPNQNDTASFKLRATLAASTDVYSTAPTTMPTVNVTVDMGTWDQPNVDAAGQTNQVTPPAMNTTQFWSESIKTLGSGQQQLKLDRLGNYIRNLIFVVRDATNGTRATGDTSWPDPITFYLDARPMDLLRKNSWKDQMWRRYGQQTAGVANDAANGLNTGVFVYDFTHDFDEALGMELRNGWLGTLGSERIDFRGAFGANTQVTILTNDVAIAGSVWS